MIARCPVCWRTAWTSSTGRVGRHNDKAGNPCPMAGHRVLLPDLERRSA